MQERKQTQLKILGSTVSTIFYALMFVGSIALAVTLFRPGVNGEMLFAAAWMCVLAAAGCLVCKFGLEAAEDQLYDTSPRSGSAMPTQTS